MLNKVEAPPEELMNEHYDYAPDKWMLIQITGRDPHYRVFGSWSGGYLGSDSWRMNSGIVAVKQVGDYYFFMGHTGSVYRCHKDMYGANVYGYGVLKQYEHDTFKPLNEPPEDLLNFDWIIKE